MWAIKVHASVASEMGRGASLDSSCNIFVFHLFVSVASFFVCLLLSYILLFSGLLDILFVNISFTNLEKEKVDITNYMYIYIYVL